MLKISKKIAALLKEINESLNAGEVIGYRELFPTNSHMEKVNTKFIVVKGITYTAGDIFWSTDTIKEIKQHHFNMLKLFVGLTLDEQKELLNKLLTFLEVYEVLGFLRSPGLSRNPTASGFTLVPEDHVDQSVKDFVKETFKEVIVDGYNDVVKEFSWWLKHGLRNNDDKAPQQNIPTPNLSTEHGTMGIVSPNIHEEEPVQTKKETTDDKNLCPECMLKALTENITAKHISISESIDEKIAKLQLGAVREKKLESERITCRDIDIFKSINEKVAELYTVISHSLIEKGATASEDEEAFKARIESLDGEDQVAKNKVLVELYQQRIVELYESLMEQPPKAETSSSLRDFIITNCLKNTPQVK